MSGVPDLGHGVGLRREHFERVLEGTTQVDWFEVISKVQRRARTRPRVGNGGVGERAETKGGLLIAG